MSRKFNNYLRKKDCMGIIKLTYVADCVFGDGGRIAAVRPANGFAGWRKLSKFVAVCYQW